MVPLICIYSGGFFTLLLAVFHTRFYKVFNWADEFGKLSIANRRIIYTIHFALFLLLFMLGIISLIYADELSECAGLAFGFNLFFSMFWIWRLIWQLVYFKRQKGQKLSPMGIFLMTLFLLSGVSYMIPLIFRFL